VIIKKNFYTPKIRVLQGDIEIAYVSTHNQLADIFTKPLDEKTFSKLRNELNILNSWNFDWNIAHITYEYTFDHVSFIWYKCILLILLVPRLRLKCFQVCISILSLRLKGKWSIRQRQGIHSNSDGIIYPFPVLM
jgi:hypothetical protein